jgi:APA family basic amino acid/polyamine antiporter
MPSSLRRELTLTNSAALVVSNMIGTGIFTTTGFLAGDLGQPSLVLGIWLVGAAIAMTGCLAYAELGINLPRSGGEYVYLREAWGPAWGFLSGWVSFFAGFSAPIAASALAISSYLAHSWPALSPAMPEGATRWLHFDAGHLLGVAFIVVFAVVNILGVRLAAKIQTVLTALKLGILGVFLFLAFAAGQGDWSHLGQAAERTSQQSLGGQFAVSLIFIMFAYSGWNAANYVAEEMKSPAQTLPKVLVLGTGLVALFYLALNVAFLYALPLESLKGVIAVGAAAATALFGDRAGSLFGIFMAVGLLSTVSAMCLVGPRVYYAMAQDRCFPAGAARLHPTRQTPVRSICYQTAASSLMVLTGTFDALIYYIGFTLILCALLAVAGLMRLRKRPEWRRLPAVSWAYPTVPLAFILTSAWMLVWTALDRPLESALGLATFAVGALVYRVRSTRAADSAQDA